MGELPENGWVRSVTFLRTSSAGVLCGAIYLHVVAYNLSAVAFYQRCGFRLLRHVTDYYLINEQYFDSIVCILTLNGAVLPHTWWQTLALPFAAVASLGRWGWRRVSGLLGRQTATVAGFAGAAGGTVLSQLDGGRIAMDLRRETDAATTELQHGPAEPGNFMV